MFVSRIVVVILWGLFWVRPVFAGPIYVQEANSITAVFFTQINLNNGLNTIKTTSLTANSDTVLYLWDPVNNVEISHNDDSQAGLASEIQVNISNTNNPTGKYWIIVHAYSSQSSGNCDVEVAGATNATFVNVYFGGRKLYVYADSQSTTGNNYHIETSLRPAPSGMVDPMMFGIQCDGEMVAYNDDGGVGKNSRISSNKVCYVLVSPYTDPYTRTLVGNEGDVRLYVNDALQHVNSDSDNDGLGEKLEQALGTCDKRTQSTPAYSCSSSNVYNLQDTDHDGLSDYQEVFGIDDPSNPQYLPRWGADPLKKDVFIEVDYFSPGNENTLGADALRKVQYYFDAGMSQSVRNPNGENGVQLHFDVGREPSENSPASDFILYGDWGGATKNIDFDAMDQAGVRPEHLINDTQYFWKIRRHIFRHFPYYFIPTWTDCGGYTPPQIPYDRIYVYGTNLCAKTIAHELGHSVGLQHYGNLSWNSNGIRCNPNYASFMSYMYDGTQFDDITKIHPGFSTTAKSSAQKLNPKALVERDGLGSTYSNMDTPDFINNIFHNGTNFGVLLPCVGVCQVDWNNDMSFSLGEEVRAPILLNRECKNNSRFNSTVMKSHSTPNTFYGTPKLVRMGQYVYLFYIDSDRKLYYRIASINTVSSGYGEFGSCQVGQDSFGATCLTWGSPIQVPNVGNHASFPNGGHFVNLSVQSLESQGYFELLLTYNYSEYPLYTINPSPIHKHYAIRTVSFNSQNGAIRWESAPTFLVQNTTSEEGELVNLSVNTSVSSSEKVLAYIYLDEDVYKYKYFIRGSSVWLSGSVEGVGGSSIKGKLGAGLVTWPDSNLSDSKTCGVFMDINKRMSFYCYEKTSNKWKFYPQAFTYALNNIQSVAKPSASFYHKRLKNGSIMPLSLNSGEIWIGIVGNPSKRGVLFRTEHLSTTSIPTYLIKRPALTISNDRKIPDGTGVFLYQDTEISAMKGVWIERRSQTSSQTNFDNLMFFPFVDATFDVELKTGNDFRVMERNICYGLHRSEYTDSNGDVDLVADADSFCGTFSNSYWGY